MAAILCKWFLVPALWFLVGWSAPENLSFQYSKSPVRIEKTNSPHPFYIAVTEINHNIKEKTLEISCKLFADDFEQALKNNYKTGVDLSSEKDKATLDKLIPHYMAKHLGMGIDGKAVKFSFIGYEKEKESAYCYLQVDEVAAVKKIDITNTILHDFTQSQTNIIHVVVNGKRQSIKLDYPAHEASFNF